MLLLDTKQIAPVGGPDGACQEFTVLGATGNGAPQTCFIQGAKGSAQPDGPEPGNGACAQAAFWRLLFDALLHGPA
eukprot:1157414-Pelagomonas_calceolata.AAC.1